MLEEMREIECSTIRVSPFQPRRTFAAEEIEELAASITAVGIIHPPVVRRIQNTRGETLYYELISGERRWRAALHSGKKSLSVLVREFSDSEAAHATLIENIQRVDLDPMEMALALKRLMDAFEMTQDQLAQYLGKKRSTVANYLRLLSLPPQIQTAVTHQEITMGHAKAILSLKDESLQESLHTLIVEQKLNVREAERESRNLVPEKGQRAKPHLEKSPLHQALKETFHNRLGLSMSFKASSSGEGQLTLRYNTPKDLEKLLNVLRKSEIE